MAIWPSNSAKPSGGCRHVAPEHIRQVTQTEAERPNPPPFTPPPLERHITEGSFFIDDHRAIRQIVDGKAEPVVYGGKTLTAYERHDRPAPRGIDRPARQSPPRPAKPKRGWPEAARNEARRD